MNPLFACLRAPRPTAVVVDIAREFSPRLQRQAPGCVVCDVSGLGRLLGDPASIGAELARSASAYESTIRVAVAPTMTAAMLLTLAHAELTVVVDDVRSALAGLPLVHLQQLVAELQGTTFLRASSTASGKEAARQRYERAFDMARRWGLTTIGEMATLDAGDLSARMGQDGVRIQQLALGRDPGPLVPDPDVPRFIGRVELEWPIDTLEPLSFVLARLLDPLSVTLERADRGAAALRLDLRLVDRTVHARLLQLPAAMRDPRVLRTLLMLDLESHRPGAAVDIVTIEIDPAPGRVIQYSLLERAVPSAETVATLTARLGALVGETRCGSAVLLDTHRPDGFEMRRFELTDRPLENAGLKRASGSGLQAPAVSSCRVQLEGRRCHPSGCPAQSSILEPEARSPKPALQPVLRRFRPPVAVRVTVERGRPVRMAIDRRGMPGGPVERSAGPWRSSGDWWTFTSGSWDRDEWDIALGDGTICRLFQQRDTGTWFVEGVMD
jgi:protein ImuB